MFDYCHFGGDAAEIELNQTERFTKLFLKRAESSSFIASLLTKCVYYDGLYAESNTLDKRAEDDQWIPRKSMKKNTDSV